MTGLDQARDNLLPKLALRPLPSPATHREHCRRATTRRSTRSFCKCRACPTTPPSPIRRSMSETNTPTCKSGSTASYCPRGYRASARSWTPISSAVCRSLPVRCRPNTVCAPPECSILPAAASLRRVARSVSTAAAGRRFTPSFDYGGSVGNSEYFVTARGNWNGLGLENPTPGLNAIHDQTQQGKFFGYASTLLDESTRFSVISAASYSAFQIPNNPGQTPLGDFAFAELPIH